MPVRTALVALLLALLGLAFSTALAAEDPLGPPSATLRLESTSVAVGVGVSWGTGTLRFQDQEHTFKVSGLSVVDLGVSQVTASGRVWGLRKLEDFDGTYTGVDLGVAVGGGTAGVAMRNENGVYIKLRAGQRGVKLSVATQGTKLELVAP